MFTATDNSGQVKLTNGVGQTITLYFGPTDFYANGGSPGSNDRQTFSVGERNGALQIYYRNNNQNYYLAATMNSNKKFEYSTEERKSLLLTPLTLITEQTVVKTEDWAYLITNTPLPPNNETSLAVTKEWKIPAGYDQTFYQEFAVTVRLLANGVNTGRTMTLNLKNNWQGVFQGLPYKDEDGNVIVYTVEENWEREKWTTSYGPIETHAGSPPTYSTVIRNTYHLGGPMLPSTGSAARMLYVLCGGSMMLGSLLIGIGSRRKRERRMK